MIYTKQITTSSAPVGLIHKVSELAITKGLVYKIDIDFPSGSAGYLGVAIFDGGFQLWPSTIGDFFTGDNTVISFDDLYLKESKPYKLRIITYNEDTGYPHLVNIRIGLVSKRVFLARFLPHYAWQDFVKMLKDLELEQAEKKEEQRQEVLVSPFPWLGGGE